MRNDIVSPVTDGCINDNTIAIDFGTSNCTAHYFYQGMPRPLEMPNGSFLLPSMVQYADKSKPICGSGAKITKNGKNLTIRSVKRILGLRKSELGEYRDINFGAQIEFDNNGNVLFQQQKGDSIMQKKPIDIARDLFSFIKKYAEQKLERKFSYVILTVPVQFTGTQKKEIRAAAGLAGFVVSSLLTEVTAAGIHYKDSGCISNDCLFLVYDLGAGTLDLSLIMCQGNCFYVIASGGDSRLGGDDFDLAIVDAVKRKYQTLTGKSLFPVDYYMNKQGQRRRRESILRNRVEEMKIILNSQPSASIDISDIIVMTDEQDDDDVMLVDSCEDILFTNIELNDIIRPMIKNTIDCITRMGNEIRQMYSNGSIGKNRVFNENDPIVLMRHIVNRVILVGGSSKLTLVKELIGNYFGNEKIFYDDDTQLCVSCGAIKSIYFSDTKRIHEVLSSCYVVYDGYSIIGRIKKGIAIPFDVSYGLKINCNTRSIHLRICECDNSEREQEIVNFSLDHFPSLSGGGIYLFVAYLKVGIDNLLSVEIHEENSGSIYKINSYEL